MLTLLALLCAVQLTPASPAKSADNLFAPHLRFQMIEDFDDGLVSLQSFPGEDAEPDSWALDSLVTYDSSRFALRLFGNTWKTESITPLVLDSADVWQVAAFIADTGRIQGFGLADSAHVLFYSFSGSAELNPDSWVTVYQGAFSPHTWHLYQLPVSTDWQVRFGYRPRITRIVFVNDCDSLPRATTYFDAVSAITEDLPVPPRVEVWYDELNRRRDSDGRWLVTIQFYSRVFDPDSRIHDYNWSFGDNCTSADSWPSHTYVVRDDHEYTVLLEVRDSTGRWGYAACRVEVDPGPTRFPVRLNFTGDIMLARRYETPGGVIDTLGPEGVFAPTRAWLGDAADITVANLECPLTNQGTRHPTKSIAFRGKPSNIAGIRYAGIDVVSQANNHVTDYGLIGLSQTQDSLTASGIRYSGAGADLYEASRPLFLDRSGVSFAFLAVSDRTGQYDNLQPYLNAGFNKPGFADMDTWRIFRQLSALDSLADRRIVEIHSGDEYSPAPNVPGTDNEDCFTAALAPSLSDVTVRRRLIDQGADLVVCHHPHVLQGLEVYRNRLIAHSLGNFAFDQDYPETYPSVILNARVNQTGFYDYTLLPIYIDDYIPRRAGGGLGVHILDYLAQRSRDLGTYLTVNPDSALGRIILDTSLMGSTTYEHQARTQLSSTPDWWVSDPVRLARQGSISAITSVTPSRNWQFRFGRDMVWMGGFEDEGSTLWWLNDAQESYDSIAVQGRRSLRQVRTFGSGTITTGFEERPSWYSDSTDYTLYGNIRTENARNAGVAVQFYTTRTGSSPIGSASLDTLITGTSDWTDYHRDFTPVPGTNYYDLWLTSTGPVSGTGQAWFDNVGIIQWDTWQFLTEPSPVVAPNDIYWVQLRCDAQTQNATLSYEETGYEAPAGISSRAQACSRPCRLTAFPNPGSQPCISYELGQPARVSLRIYDVLGRERRALLNACQRAGRQLLVWDGRDNLNRKLGSGTYFCRLQTRETSSTLKLVLQP